MPDAVLALDQGTTGSMALVLSDQGEVLGRAYGTIKQHYPQPGWVEHDPEELVTVSQRVMYDALADARIDPHSVKAIGITNQRETTVVWDRKTGTPLHRAIVWQSRQTAPICERLRAEGHEPEFRRRTGLVMDAYFSGTKIRWILDRYPDAPARAAAGDLAFGTVDTWLLERLTGVHATDPTNASRTLLYNIDEQRWDPVLLAILGVPEAMMPEVRRSAGFFGELRPAGGLPGGIPVTGVAGDQQAALHGQGCWEQGLGKNTYGTGCFLMLNTGGQRAPTPEGLLATICCDARGGAAYALEGSVFVAGAAVQWLRDELAFIVNAADTDAMARSVPNTGGVYVVPAFTGLGAPYWDMDARGAVIGLTRGSDRRHIVRATLESMAYQTRDVLEAMNAGTSEPLRELRVDGGASANDFLMQFQADILGIPVDRPAWLETTAAGAAYLAGLGAGVWKDPGVLANVRRRERLFEPRMTAGLRESLYSGWKQAVARVRTR